MIKRFIPYYKPHLKLFFLDIFCALIVAILNLFYPVIARDIINVYAFEPTLNLLLVWSAVLLGIYAVKCALRFIIDYWGHVVGVRIQGDMRRDIFAHLENMPFTYFDENKTGSIMSRIINDLFEISELAHHGPEDVFLSLVTFIGVFIMLALSNVKLALIVLAFAILGVAFALFMRAKMTKVWQEMREETAEINANIEASVSGIRVSKAYTAEDYENARFAVSNNNYQRARSKAYKIMAVFHSGTTFATDLLYLVALCVGGILLFKGEADSGEVTMYILYITSLIAPISTFVTIFEEIQGGMTGFKRFCEVMDVAPEPDPIDAVHLDRASGDIEFKDVSFKYKNIDAADGHMVISHLNLKIEAGKTIAFVGPSGGGKTTMCHLIPRFYEIDSGEIAIDGIDNRKITRRDLRRNIGMVAQDVFLFNGTIKENIAYGDFSASDEEVISAAKRANIHDFIMTLPNGYETNVGERGVKLSGGQKQRVSIARVFLKNPPILILDEATSALDNVTEMQIQQALTELAVGRTTLIVAHRLSTVRRADTIYVVSVNGIEESGTHDELVAKDGVYAKLYNYQAN